MSAHLASFPPPDSDPGLDSEDWIGLICTFVDGGIATLDLSWVTDPAKGLRVTIVGSDGVLTARAPGAMLTEGEIAITRSGDDA